MITKEEKLMLWPGWIRLLWIYILMDKYTRKEKRACRKKGERKEANMKDRESIFVGESQLFDVFGKKVVLPMDQLATLQRERSNTEDWTLTMCKETGL